MSGERSEAVWDRTSDEHELARIRTAEAKRRTHLANERTYAAWIRTALTLIGLGVGIAGYFHLAGNSRVQMFVVLGMAFVVVGALMAALFYGLLLGLGRVMQGSLFLSYALWSAIVVWFVVLIIYWALLGRAGVTGDGRIL